MGNGDGIIQTSPYLVVSDLLRGFKVSGSLKNGFTVQNKYILQNFNADWIIKATQAFVSKRARDVKPMSVLLRHNTDAGLMDIPLVQGMPFITAVYRNLAPSLATIRSILSVRVDDSATFAQGSTTSKGTKFVVHLNSNAYWVIYSSSPIAFKISNELTAQEIGNFVIKIGLLGLEDLSSKWDRFSKSYAESADIKHQTIDNIAILTYAWEKKGAGDLLMFALPHHVDHLVSGQRAGIVSYTIKGEMQGIIGDEWKMEMQLSTIGWYARNPIDPNKKQDILNALKAEVNDVSLTIKAGDPYWFGLEIARAARWALIADQLNENEIAKQVRSTMKDALIPWLEYKNANPLK
jgi:endo-1,3(4)-beta-glucanase